MSPKLDQHQFRLGGIKSMMQWQEAVDKEYAQSRSSLKQRTLLAFLAFAAMAVALLWQDHREHIPDLYLITSCLPAR